MCALKTKVKVFTVFFTNKKSKADKYAAKMLMMHYQLSRLDWLLLRSLEIKLGLRQTKST